MLRHTLIVALLLALSAAGLAVGTPRATRIDPPATTPPPPTSAIRIVIDYKDGVQKCFLALEHRADMTALDATIEASRHARGIKLEYTGKGEMAFVNQIDDLKNQGAGKSARNWQFSINGKRSTRGAGVVKLEAGDTLLWEFETFNPPN